LGCAQTLGSLGLCDPLPIDPFCAEPLPVRIAEASLPLHEAKAEIDKDVAAGFPKRSCPIPYPNLAHTRTNVRQGLGLLVGDIDLAAATGLLASRYKPLS
jgi:hypothetical protein